MDQIAMIGLTLIVFKIAPSSKTLFMNKGKQ